MISHDLEIMVTGALRSDPEVAWLLKAANTWLESSEEGRYDPGWFHASDLGQSDEYLLQRYRGWTATQHTAQQLRVFDNGHSRDADWKRYLAGSGLSSVGLDEETRRVRIPGCRLTGRFDDLVANPETGQRSIFEFKTINDFSYRQLAEPKPEHIQQVTSYMFGTGLNSAIVLYENKNNQSLRGFWVPFDVEEWASIESRLLRLRVEGDAQKETWSKGDPRIVEAARKFAESL